MNKGWMESEGQRRKEATYIPAESLHGLIEEQVAKTPDSIAVKTDLSHMSYAELDGAANRLAHYLREIGVEPGVIVGVCMERDTNLSLALLAILKAGGAYLPLDPSTPVARSSFLVEDADIALLITQSHWMPLDWYSGLTVSLDKKNIFLDAYPSTPPNVEITGDDMAYVIYTSGSTGKPKGCMLPHRAICNRLQWMQAQYSLDGNHRVLQKTPFTFDVSVWELFWPLIAGASIYFASQRGHKDSHYLCQIISEQNITHCHFVPSMLRFFLNDPEARQCSSLQDVFVSGEALPYSLMEQFLDTLDAKLHNLYGPTEAAVDVSYWQCHRRDDGVVPIGREISNVELRVVGDDLETVEDGEEGELCIGGLALAIGYLNQPVLTDEKFVNAPDGKRFYRTGDRARRLPDGNLDFLGRTDFQVKLRGLRIELGEIESNLREHPDIREVVVLVRGEEEQRLVAYLETSNHALDFKAIRQFLGSQLPDYMVPTLVYCMTSLPVTVHGKLDRGALPWPLPEESLTPDREQSEITDASDVQLLRATITDFVAQALEQKSIDIDADLFDIGATSLTLVRVFEKIREEYGVVVTVDDFLDTPTVRFIINRVEGEVTDEISTLSEPVKSLDKTADIEPSIIKLVRGSVRKSSAEYQGKKTAPINLAELGKLLGRLSMSIDKDGSQRYLYPSAGNLNAIRTYVSVSEGFISDLPAGGYYYHPENHSLQKVGAGNIGLSNGAGVFFVAAMDAIKPIYQGMSVDLARLESGYMAHLLAESAKASGVNATSANFDLHSLRREFAILPDECFIHSLILNNDQNTSQSFINSTSLVDPRLMDYSASIDPASMNLAEVKSLHEKKLHLRTPESSQDSYIFPPCDFPWKEYRRRACHRSYLNEYVELDDLGQLLEEINITDTALEVYVYVRQTSFNGLEGGVYRYCSTQHTLEKKGQLTDNEYAKAWTPFNRQHGRSSAFTIFLVSSSQDVPSGQLQAGSIGQKLMQVQAEFGIGLCPIGAMRFEIVANSAGLSSEYKLIHSFVGGKVARQQETLAQDTLSKQNGHREIVIVGISGRYPDAENTQELWRNLEKGKCSITTMPTERQALTGGSSSQLGAYLNDIDCFDSMLFRIPPVEARSLDPQERLLLEAAWACLEDAGHTASSLSTDGQKVGVFIGAMWNDYQSVGVATWLDGEGVKEASHHASLANRISYVFDFNGPSVAVNTSCSSSMTALHLARESLLRGECDSALVGGVNLMAHAYHRDLLERLGLVSVSGKAAPFSATADGWLPGEGVGMILLRSRESAENDKDSVRAIVKQTLIGHSGRTSRYGAPSAERQAQGMRDTLSLANVSPDEISYVEAAAPGAALADAAEVTAIRAVLDHERSSPCYLGTIKANIGHLESASAMSQMAKVIEQMQRGKLLPVLESGKRSPLIDMEGSYLQIVTETTDWLSDTHEKLALINVLGAAGSQGHILLQSYQSSVRPQTEQLVLVPLSAATPEALKSMVQRLSQYLDTETPAAIADISFTLMQGRELMKERIALVVETPLQLKQELEKYLSTEVRSEVIVAGNIVSSSATEHLIFLAGKWLAGGKVDWSADLPNGHRVALPVYPFARHRHWLMAASEQPGSSELESDAQEKVTEASQILPLHTLGYLRKLITAVTEIPEQSLRVDVLLEDIGLSSLMIEELNERLEADLGSMRKTLFFEYRSLNDLAKGLSNEYPEALSSLLSLPMTPFSVVPGPKNSESRTLKRDQIADEPIAVIGISGRYPGASNLDEFWQNLLNGVDCITEIPDERWNHEEYFNEEKGIAGKTYSKWGGFLDDIDAFDPLFFKISPRDSVYLDPQERLFLQTAWHAFEDAGYNHAERCRLGNQIGVFAGVMYSEYQLHPALPNGLGVSTSYGTIANRVSYVLDLQGPSMAVDTLCASSLTALHLACESLKRGECDAALAGGVNLSIHPSKYLTHAMMTMSSTDGRCKSFGDGGSGFVPAEGVGAVILKPLSKAEEDGDHIYGVISGTATNHGGRTNGFTVPDPSAQSRLIESALQRAGVSAREISYVEAHGTGTALGDPIEIEGLKRAFSRYSQDRGYCSIGSVKSNIGHAEAAAGIAALSKVLLQIQHKMLVPSLHSASLNQGIDFDRSPFVVQREVSPWSRPALDEHCVRKAGISSFGAGGANAHIIVEEYEPQIETRSIDNIEPVIILLSAVDEERLRALAALVITSLSEKSWEESDLGSIAFTLQVGREAQNARLAFLASSISDIRDTLNQYVQDESILGIYTGTSLESSDALSLLEGEELQEIVRSWQSSKRYDKLMSLWVKGLEIDWRGLYSSRTPRRVSLPGYPFKKERYWAGKDKGLQPKRRPSLISKEWTVAPLSESAPLDPTMDLWVLAYDSESLLAESLISKLGRGSWLKPTDPEAVAKLTSSQDIKESIWVDLCGLNSLSSSMDGMEALQCFLGICGQSNSKVLGVTQGLESINGSSAGYTGIERASLYRALGSEYAKIDSRHIDAGAEYKANQLVDLIVQELSVIDQNTAVCYQQGKRFCPSLVEISPDDENLPVVPRTDEVLWITGGTKGIGLTCAQHFVRNHGVRKLLLSDRQSWPPRDQWNKEVESGGPLRERILSVLELESEGAQINICNATLGNSDELNSTLRNVESNLGAITAVIHCAGLLDKERLAFSSKTRSSIASVIYPKRALGNMIDYFDDRKLHFMVAFSSVSALVPKFAAGGLDYVMANSVMDQIVHTRQTGYPLLSLQWPNWKGSGMGEANSRVYKSTGLPMLSNQEGLKLLDTALTVKTNKVLLPTLIDESKWNPDALLQLGKAPPAKSIGLSFAKPPEQQITVKEEAVSGDWLHQICAQKLSMNIEQLNPDVALQDYGADSVVITEITKVIGERLGNSEIDPSIFYEYPTVSKLSAWLIKEYGDVIPESGVTSIATVVANFPQTKVQVDLGESDYPNSVKSTDISGSDIAVIGLSCRFPGAESEKEFWELLSGAESALRLVPSERWTGKDYAGLLNNITDFDPEYFGLTFNDAKAMDPQALILLEETLSLISHAGYSTEMLKGTDLGVFIGARTRLGYDKQAISESDNPVLAVGQNYLAANISRYFDWHGPSMVVDTACSSALTAMNLARHSILSGEIDAAVVGGISLFDGDDTFRMFEQRGLLCSQPPFHLFDKRANGTLLGEGAGLVLLKRLGKARSDGDRILSVIKGMAINNNGRGAGPAAPNFQARKQVMIRALADAGISPDSVTHIEVNGSGSEVDDLLELKAMKSVYRSNNDSLCSLGSVKPNIGHTLCAEGIAGFIKIVQMMNQGKQVPFLSGHEAMAHFDIDSSPFHFHRDNDNWSQGYAALSCFADGGTNAHVIIGRPLDIEKGREPIPMPQLTPKPITGKRESTIGQTQSIWQFVSEDLVCLRVSDPVLGGHRVFETPILPGLAYIDLLYQWFQRQGKPANSITLQDLTLHHPLLAEGKDDIKIRLSATEVATGLWDLSVDSVPANGEKPLCYVTAKIQQKGPPNFTDSIDLTAIEAATSSRIELEDLYAECRQYGLNHAPEMRVQGQVLVTDDALYMTARLNDQVKDAIFHPALIDSSAVGLAWASKRLFDNTAADLSLPLIYEGFHANALMGDNCIARLRKADIRSQGELHYITIAFFNSEGHQIAELVNLVAKSVRDTASLLSASAKSDSVPVTKAQQSLGNKVKRENHETFLASLRELLAQWLSVPVEKVDIQAGFYELGLTSANLLEMVNEISEWVGETLSPTLFFEYSDLESLAHYLNAHYSDCLSQTPEVESHSVKPMSIRSEAKSSPSRQRMDKNDDDGLVAIIGMSGRFPGGRDLSAFWNSLAEGMDCITEVPLQRWDWRSTQSIVTNSGKPVSRWGGFVDDVDCFDPRFFRISPYEAELLDPQERHFLEVCWEAIEDSGYTPNTLVTEQGPSLRRPVGVYAGVMHKDYTLLGAKASRADKPLPLTLSNAPIANRVSYVCGFHGPSMSIDTVCSSSLVSVQLAVESLRRGECEVALAGGVNFSLDPNKYITYGLLGMHASDGRCRTFGEGGDGYVSSDGVGAVVLKPLSRAKEDGDNIYSVIRGAATNHVGAVSGFTVPGPVAQADMIATSLEDAGVNPRTISYLEAHGTGTSLGDPIEIEGLTKAFRRYTDERQYCAIGSVKSNIGHAESAAGIGGLIKVSLMLKKQMLLPSLHSGSRNPHIDWDSTPFFIQREYSEWPAPVIDGKVEPRRAGISSFGATGSNAHIILEEYVDHAPVINQRNSDPVVIVLSAKSDDQLRKYAQRLSSVIDDTTEPLLSIAYTLQVGRVAHSHRLAMVVFSVLELEERLSAFIADKKDHYGLYTEANAQNPSYVSLSIQPGENEQERANRLARHWVNGTDIDWKSLYGEQTPSRISLPTYPFARERYWLPDAEPAESSIAPDVSLPKAEELEQIPEISLRDPSIETLDLAKWWKHADVIMAEVLAAQMDTLGLFDHEIDKPASEIRELLQLPDSYQRWIDESLRVITEHGFLSRNDQGWSVQRRPDAWAAWEKWELLRDDGFNNTALREQVRLLDITLRALPKVLRGEQPATALMFPGGSLKYVEGIYKDHPLADYFNDVLAESLMSHLSQSLQSSPQRKLKMLEIGAGTGGTSSLLFKRMTPIAKSIKEYRYTDISMLFLSHAKEKYSEVAPYLETAILDIQRPPAEQGLETGVYDAVIATNVLHATSDIRRTVLNARKLLRKGGAIFINEMTDNALALHLTFGLLDGWWVYTDESVREPGGPALSPDTWKKLLTEEGYTSIIHPAKEWHGLGQQVVIALHDGTEVSDIDDQPNDLKEVDLIKTGKAKPSPVLDRLTVLVREKLVEEIASLLKMDSSEIRPDTSMSEFGFDSITLTALSKRLNDRYGLVLNPTVFFEHSTLSSLAGYLSSSHSEILSSYFEVEDNKVSDLIEDTAVPVDETVDINEPVSLDVADNQPSFENQSNSSTELDSSSDKTSEPIAIIGISGCFPEAENIEALWQNLVNGRDSISTIPISRWDVSDLKQGANQGGLISNVDEFDPLFFGISPREAESMDPQQRLLMSYVWNVIEDAGYSSSSLAGTNTSLFVGTGSSGYGEQRLRSGALVEGQSAMGMMPSIGPNRMSYFLDIQGASEPIETACSSSLVAIHRACITLRTGQSDMAIAGGVNTLISPELQLSFSRAGMLSESGRCKAFSNNADGYVRGEGVGMLLLKPLSAAERDGDIIHAVIRGSAQNHGGRANSLTAPNPKSQAAVIKAALKDAQVDASSIGYIEAHGTGTPLGDPIEIQGLKEAFDSVEERQNQCGIGSIKSNIGHLELAAGIAGVMKVLLQMKHRTLVKSLHTEEINPYIDLHDTPFHIVRENSEWKPFYDSAKNEIPLRAGISSFGAGGSNAHVIIEEYKQQDYQTSHVEKPVAVVLSARDSERLRNRAADLYQALSDETLSEVCLEDIAYTLQIGRDSMSTRWACVVDSKKQLIQILEDYLNDKNTDGLYLGDIRHSRKEIVSLLDDEEMISTVQGWLSKQKYSQVLDLWSRGFDVDWSVSYEGKTPRRARLPGYPFAASHYWFKSETKIAPPAMQLLHPLLHQQSQLNEEFSFSSTFSGNEFFLADHVVRGNKVLPGVAYLEIAREAQLRLNSEGKASNSKGAYVIENLVFLAPFVADAAPKSLGVKIESQQDKTAEFRIYSDMDSNSMVCQGRVGADSVDDTSWFNLSSLRSQKENKTSINTDYCYSASSVVGVDYGPAFKALTHIDLINVSGQTLALSGVEVPKSAKGDFVLHPSLMDAAWHSGLILMNQVSDMSGLALPFALDRMVMFRPVNQTAAVVAKLADHGKSKSVRKIDIEIYDQDDCLAVRFEGLTCRIIDIDVKETEISLWQHHWQAREAMSVSGIVNDSRHVILCGVCPEFKEAAGNIEVSYWQGYKSEHFSDLSASLLIYLKTLSVATGSGKSTLLQLVVPAQGEGHIFSGLSGMLKSASQEIPRLRTQLLSVDTNIDAQTISRYLDENASCTDDEVRYLSGYREIPSLHQVQEHDGNEITIWRSSGVYLITGAAGGVGRAIAQSIVTRVTSPTLLLVGRSPANAEFKSEIEQLRQKGASVSYHVLDITDPAAVEALISDSVSKYGQINGVLHCAGVTRDGLLASKSVSELHQVLSPKVAGTLVLDQAIGSLQLDWMVLFSSIAAQFGNIGQSDYAAANAFLGAFAQRRQLLVDQGKRSGKTLSIDWPVWEDGGMKIDELRRRQMRRLFGLVPLSTASGIEAMEASLGSCDSRVMVWYGDAAKLHENQKQEVQVTSSPSKDLDMSEAVEGWLTIEIGKTLGIDPDHLDPTAELSEFGFDSIALTTFSNQLSEEYGIEINASIFFEYTTIELFSGYLALNYPDVVGPLLNEDKTSLDTPEEQTEGDSDLHERVEAILLEEMSKQLMIAPSELDVEAELSEFGLDSIALTTFINHLNEEYEIELSPVVFFEYPTLEQFAGYLVREHAGLLGTLPEIAAQVEGVEDNKKVVNSEVNEPPSPKSDAVTPSSTQVDDGYIAIVAMNGRYPGSNDIDEFWANLVAGKDSITEPPEERWSLEEFFTEDREEWGKTYGKWGGFINEVSHFDPLFFGISPREAEIMDPHVRLFMETVWHLFEAGGYTREALGQRHNNRVGVYVGAMYHHYRADDLVKDSFMSLASHSSIANRISHFFGLDGPSIAIDTMCSSSLMAVHQACKDIREGECELAVAGGVNLTLHPNKYIGLSQAQLLGSHPGSRSFAEDGDGYLPAEAVGAVLLKPLSRALEDGDQVWAVIRGSATAHGGRSNGYSTPNPNAQSQSMLRSLEKSGLTHQSIGYIEAAANGSSLNDAVEVSALMKVFGDSIDSQEYALGSVKSNIGHAEAASGMAQLMKAALQLHYGELVPTIGIKKLNSALQKDNVPFILQQSHQEWPSFLPRRSLVNSFGAGGSYVSLVVEAASPSQTRCPPLAEGEDQVIVLSARTETALMTMIMNLVKYLDSDVQVPLESLAYTLQCCRETMEVRLALVVSDMEELKKRLRSYVSGSPIDELNIVNTQLTRGALNRQMSRKERERYVSSHIASRNLQGLSDYWSQGGSIPWSRMWGENYKVEDIPKYPFERDSYWSMTLPSSESGSLSVMTQPLSDPAILENTSKVPITDVESVTYHLMKSLAEALSVPVDRISPDRPMREYGLDSVLTMQLIRDIQEIFGVRIMVKTLLNHPTVDDLAGFIVNSHSTPQVEKEPPSVDQKYLVKDSSYESDLHDALQKFEQGQIDLEEMEKMISNGDLL